jgi:hypothetical protein
MASSDTPGAEDKPLKVANAVSVGAKTRTT